jgi:hypothetical protein
MVSFSIVTVSAFIYETVQQTVTQNIQIAATLTLSNSALGNILEGDTLRYTKVGGGGDIELATLGDAITITTSKTNIYLHLDSDLNDLTCYSTYNITIKFSQVMSSTYSVGDVACTLSLASPDYSAIDLDATGEWMFDIELITTANSVDSDTPTTVTISVMVEYV